MRLGKANPGLLTYLGTEPLLNNFKRVSINSDTEEALAVALVDSSGNQLTPTSTGSGIVSGTKTVTTAGTAVRINVASVTIKGIWLSADLGNANPVVVGDSAVVAASGSQRGIVLVPGNDPIFLPITELNTLWVDSQTNGDKLSYAYIT